MKGASSVNDSVDLSVSRASALATPCWAAVETECGEPYSQAKPQTDRNRTEMIQPVASWACLTRFCRSRGRSREGAGDLIQPVLLRLEEFCRNGAAEVRNREQFLAKTVAPLDGGLGSPRACGSPTHQSPSRNSRTALHS